MSVHKFMDTSTCYITLEDNDKLYEEDFPFTVISYDQGFFIYCGASPFEIKEECSAFGMSPEFIALLQYAHDQDCWFIRIDADGDSSLNFPKFTW